MSQRTTRVAELVRAELNELILHKVKDPRVRLATVSAVQLSGDLGHARVSISVLGEDDDRQSVVDALTHAGGYLRGQLSKRLRLRVAPQLVFTLDRGAEHSQRISDLLENLHVGDESS